jgi:hypothetical protein
MSPQGMSNTGTDPADIARAQPDDNPASRIEDIDLERLAEAVLALLKREASLERERLGSYPQSR